jgi:putative transposase
MRSYLGRLGYQVNRKRIQRLMGLMGFASIAPRKRTTVSGDDHKIYLYFLKIVDIHGTLYLMLVKDGYSRYLLS